MEKCDVCQKSFTSRSNMLRHVLSQHKKSKQWECEECSRVFSNKANLTRHLKTCKGEQPSSSTGRVQKRKQSSSKTPNKKMKIGKPTNHHVVCAICHKGFTSKKMRDQHVIETHHIPPIDLYTQYVPSFVSGDDETMQCVEDSLHLIMRPHDINADTKQLNFFRFTELSFDDMTLHLAEVFSLHDEAFKLNISFGFIMTHIETGEHQYFYPARNQTLLNEPFRISQSSDVALLLQLLKDKDILEHVLQQRPDTKWRLTHITNVLYITYNLRHVIESNIELPDYLLNKNSLICFIKNRKGIPFNDNLCMFRALMYHVNQSYDIERAVEIAYLQWNNDIPKNNFTGVKLEEIPKFEEIFNINVNIYSLSEDDQATMVYKPAGLYEDTLYLDKYLNHVSYIKNFKAYANKFTCRKCKRFFKRSHLCNKHEPICDDSARYKYPGGFYSSKKNVFEQLMDIGINVAESDRYHNDFCVYDFESMLIPDNQLAGSQNKILSKHHPISVSVCSTLSRSPECYVSEKTEDLVSFRMNYFNTIQQRVTRQMMLRYKQVFDILEEYQSITKVIKISKC